MDECHLPEIAIGVIVLTSNHPSMLIDLMSEKTVTEVTRGTSTSLSLGLRTQYVGAEVIRGTRVTGRVAGVGITG